MGNSSSSPGRLSIVLDPPPSSHGYIAGQKLSGSVYIQSTTNVSHDQPINVSAYLSGKERTRVRYTVSVSDGNNGTRSETRYATSERQVVRMALDLGNITTPPTAGSRYRFPFEIQLPSDLPSTMCCNEHHSSSTSRGYCEINYKIKAEINSNRQSSWSRNHKVEQLFNVVSTPLPMQPVPNLIPPVTHQVTHLCCLQMGQITMGARVANTRIGRGETALIDFACQNQSLRQIERVEVTVKEEVSWSAGGRSNHASGVIATSRFRPTARWQKIDKEKFKEDKVKSRSPTDTYRGQQQEMLRIVHAAIHDGENRAQVTIPSSGIQSYQGVLIKVNHRLKIKVYTGGTCTENPTIKTPIYLGTPSSLLPVSQTQPPPDPNVAVGAASPLPTAAAVPIPSAPPLSIPAAAAAAAVVPSAPPAEWANAVTATPVVVGQSTAIVGGNSVWEVEEGDANTNNNQQSNVVMAVAEIVPSLANLLKEIEYAVSPLTVVRRRLDEEEWKARVFYVMTPKEYASVIRAVSIEFDQPDMAALVAPVVNACHFTHNYVIAALRVVSDWLRTPLLSKVLPLCKDLHDNADRIKAELSDWELVCTQRDFEEAAANNG